MENSLKGLILTAGMVITCVVLGLAFFVSRQSKSTAMDSIGNVDKMNIEFSESDITIYDGSSVSGKEVLSVIEKYKTSTDFGIIVTTKKATTYYIKRLAANKIEFETDVNLKTESLASAKNKTNNAYINPQSQFIGSVLRDLNNRIIGITFVQE